MIIRTLLASMLAATLLVPLPAYTQPTLTGVESLITQRPGDQYDPAISGNIIAYTDDQGDPNYLTEIWYYDLFSGREVQITQAWGEQQTARVSAGRIFFTDGYSNHLMLYSTETGTSTDVTPEVEALAFEPSIDQNLIAWTDMRNGNRDIYAMNFLTGETRRLTDSTDIDQTPAVGGSLIAWEHCTMTPATCDITAYDWTTGTTRQITATPDGVERRVDVSNGRLVYESLRNGDSDVILYDFAAGTERQLALPGDQSNPSISGDLVAFEDDSSGNLHIRLWYLPSDAIFDLTAGTANQFLNDLDGNRVVYTDDRGSQYDIYMYQFTIEEPQPVCREVTLEASKTYRPSRWTDASQSLTPAMRFVLPSEIPVTQGSSGKHFVTFSWTSNGQEVSCRYKGDESFSGNQVESCDGDFTCHHHHHHHHHHSYGLRYKFLWCDEGVRHGSRGIRPGDIITADSVELHLHNGDIRSGETQIKLVLEELAPCGDTPTFNNGTGSGSPGRVGETSPGMVVGSESPQSAASNDSQTGSSSEPLSALGGDPAPLNSGVGCNQSGGGNGVSLLALLLLGFLAFLPRLAFHDLRPHEKN